MTLKINFEEKWPLILLSGILSLEWIQMIARESLSAALLVRDVCEFHPDYRRGGHLTLSDLDDREGKHFFSALQEDFC